MENFEKAHVRQKNSTKKRGKSNSKTPEMHSNSVTKRVFIEPDFVSTTDSENDSDSSGYKHVPLKQTKLIRFDSDIEMENNKSTDKLGFNSNDSIASQQNGKKSRTLDLTIHDISQIKTNKNKKSILIKHNMFGNSKLNNVKMYQNQGTSDNDTNQISRSKALTKLKSKVSPKDIKSKADNHNILKRKHLTSSKSFTEIEISDSTESSVSSLSSDSVLFDESGELAEKILLNIKSGKKTLQISDHTQPEEEPQIKDFINSDTSTAHFDVATIIKDKSVDISSYSDTTDDTDVSEISIKPMFVNKLITEEVADDEYDSIDIEPNILIPDSDESDESNFKQEAFTETPAFLDTNCESPPYESVLAAGIECTNIDDVLGNYVHSTFYNLPSHTHIDSKFVNKAFKANVKRAEVNVPEDEELNVSIIDSAHTTNHYKDKEFEVCSKYNDSNNISFDSDNHTVLSDNAECIINLDDTTNSVSSTMRSNYISMTSEIANDVQDSSDDTEDGCKAMKLENKKLKIYETHNGYVAVLTHPCEIYLHGKVLATSLCGQVEVLGSILDSSKRQLYAPNYYCALTLKTITKESSTYGLFNKLSSLGLPVLKTEEIVVSLQEYDAVIHFERLNDDTWEFVEKNFSTIDLFNKSYKYLEEDIKKANDNLGCCLYPNKPYNSFEEDPSWNGIITSAFSKYQK